MTGSDSTTADLPDRPRGRAGRWAHRGGVALLVVLVAAGASGALGPRAGHTAATGGGYHLRVTYPEITRAGQPAPLHLVITREGGFEKPVQVALCDDFFDNLDFQGWFPAPAAEAGDPDAVVYEFDPPRAEELEISLDARSAPGQFAGAEKCSVEVLEDDEPVAAVSFTSWRMP
ncbi:hypothetical protein [Nocardioides houyundeii]|uniref:hypothetical protein n=1 Tax=Nocardioides houyundeii TaxID=2045452 RepID=UPI000C76A13A|nr:hypothetical protein [Nocardioides houyundeii]